MVVGASCSSAAPCPARPTAAPGAPPAAPTSNASPAPPIRATSCRRARSRRLDAVLLGGGGLDEALPQGDPLRDLSTERLLAQGRAEDGTPDTLRRHDLCDLEVGAVDRIGQRPR